LAVHPTARVHPTALPRGRAQVNAFYSTPSMYLRAKVAAGPLYGIKTDDFFPYFDGPHA
jgi:hypothetical protein